MLYTKQLLTFCVAMVLWYSLTSLSLSLKRKCRERNGRETYFIEPGKVLKVFRAFSETAKKKNNVRNQASAEISLVKGALTILYAPLGHLGMPGVYVHEVCGGT